MCSVLNLITATLPRIFGVVKRYARTCKVMSCTYVGRFQNFKFGSWERGKGGGVVAAGLCGLAVGSLMLVGAAYGLYNKVSTASRLTAEAVGDAGKVGQASQVGQASKVSQASKVGQAPSEPGRQPSVRSSTSQGSIATNATFASVGD